MPGPTVGELMSDQHPTQEYDDDDDDDDDEDNDDDEEDDFVPRRRHLADSDKEDAPSPKKGRYSPSAPNGHAAASSPVSASIPPPYVPPLRMQPSQTHPRKPPLEHSILNVEPIDEFIREVADFVHHHIANRTEHVEVEAKIGILRDRSGQRLRLPVGVETTLSSDLEGVNFESNMSVAQHRHYNTLLNNLGSEPASSEAPRTPLKYLHSHLLDSFYPSPDGARDKIRVTTNEQTREVVQCVRKVRLGDLNIYCPKRNADWRISVNLEVPMPQPTGTPTHTRKKDRLTYTHQYCNIDLTQVRQSTSPGSTPTVLHELELEFNSTATPILLHAASQRNSQNPSLSQEQRDEFDEIMRIFVNNSRILVRNASPGWEGG